VKNKKSFKSCFAGSFLIVMIFFLSAEAFSQEYFQQRVNYVIRVKLDDKRNELSSYESVEYTNNSPDTLQFIFFHLWPNAYSSNNTDLAKQLTIFNGKARLFNDPELKGYIDSLDFKVGNKRVSWHQLPGQPDICRVLLNEPLIPGGTIIITTPFHVRIPKGVTSRLGHIGQSYQISQWYPKPAVYDREGWHQMPYLDQGEFYSEYGCFDVSITLPANYTVGASGNLQDEAEMERLNTLVADTLWKVTAGYVSDNFPVSSDQIKTLRYTATDIHDFAWFADKRYHVMKGRVQLPASGREVTTWIMFTNSQANLWKVALNYVNSSITYFSGLIGDYPYETFTAVQSALTAGAGMEYPGLTVIGIENDAYSLNDVLAHEICHNWFYSALGSNERRYPFMDEGITTSYEQRYMNDRYPGKKLWELYFKSRKLAKFLHVDRMPVQRKDEIEWLIQARQNLEQPIDLPAPDYSYINYSTIIYTKTAMGFGYLRAYLGDSVFDASMQAYYRKWKSKHPYPDDLRAVFEGSTGKNLDWFFGDFIGTTKRTDYKVARYDNKQVLIKNKGEMLSPLVISGVTGDSVFFQNWSDGFAGKKWISVPGGSYSEIKIDPLHVMTELHRLNNNIRRSGIFRKADPLQPQLLFTIEDPGRRYLIYLPSVNWTAENGFMIGVALTNGLIITKPVEYLAMPFLSFNGPSFAGYGRLAFNIIPYDNFIRLAKISFEGTQFGAPFNQSYLKGKIGMDLFFRTKSMVNPVTQRMYANYIAASDLYQIEHQEKADIGSYFQAGYIVEQAGYVNPFTLTASFELHSSYQKAAAELLYRYSYYGKSSGLDMRFFAGTMFKNSAATFYALSPAGRSGREDYLYTGIYPDRFAIFPKTFLSRQMTLSEGGLVSPVNDSLGYSNWIISLSLTSNLPGIAGRMPVKPFINLLLNDHGNGTGHNSPFFYEAGLKAGIWNFFEIYVPLLVSSNIESISGSFKDRIRFVLRLDSFFKLRLKTMSA
jgi:Peptidase family M1 domain